jgi:hypothetical protein
MTTLLPALTTSSSETSRAQLVADSKARDAALQRWRGELNKYSDDKYRNKATILPEDIQYIKAFLRKRVDEITTKTSITTAQLVALDQDKDTLNYQTLIDTYGVRRMFMETLTQATAAVDAALEELKKKGIPVSTDLTTLGGLLEAQKVLITSDLKNSRLLSKDILQDKMADLWDTILKLPDLKGASFKTISAVVGQLKKAATDAEQKALENPIGTITWTAGKIVMYIFLSGIGLVILGFVISYAMNGMVHRGIVFRVLIILYALLYAPIRLIAAAIEGKWPKFFNYFPLIEGDRKELSRLTDLFFGFLFFTITPEEKERMMRGEFVEGYEETASPIAPVASTEAEMPSKEEVEE